MTAAVVSRLLVALLLISLAIPAPAHAVWPFSALTKDPPPAAAPAPAPAPASTAITAPEVARRAEEASKLLRDIDALLVPGPGITSIQERLPDLDHRLVGQGETTKRQLDEGPSGPTLEVLTQQWQSLRAELATYVGVLAERGTSLERGLNTLTRLRETWTRARTDVRASKPPEQVVERINGILSAIGTAHARLSQERAATLVLQDRVAQHVAQCDETLAKLVAVRAEIAERILARDGVPLSGLPHELAQLGTHLRQVFESAVADVREYGGERRPRLYLNVLLVAGGWALTYAARRKARAQVPAPGGQPADFRALEHPLAAALMLVFLATIFAPPRTRAPQTIAEIVTLVATVIVIRATVPRWRLRALYWLGALVMMDLVRRLAASVPFLEQEIFVLEAIVVSIILGGKLAVEGRRWLRPAEPPQTVWDRLVPFIVAGSFVAVVGSGIAAALGYVRLGIFVGSGILGNVYVGLVLYAGVRVIAALIALALCLQPLKSLRIVTRHRALIDRRIRAALRWIAFPTWAILLFRHFGVWSTATALAVGALATEWHIGSLTVPVAGVVVFVATIAATFAISAVLRFLLQEEIYPRVSPTRVLPYAVSTIVHYTLLFVGFLIGLAALGVDLTKITIVASALGVGIGFGLQSLVNNFVSGLVILSERRINVGDAVQVGEIGGVVQQLGIRACTVRTWEGAEVIVPNAILVTEKVTNWTLSDRLRRIDVSVRVAYGTPPEKVTELLLDIARAHPSVMTAPAPLVFFMGVGAGDNALRFDLRAWTENFDRWALTQSEMTVSVHAALRDAAIDLPFTQHDVRLRRE